MTNNINGATQIFDPKLAHFFILYQTFPYRVRKIVFLTIDRVHLILFLQMRFLTSNLKEKLKTNNRTPSVSL